MEEDAGLIPENEPDVVIPDLQVGDAITAYGQRFILTDVFFEYNKEPHLYFATPVEVMEEMKHD